MANLSDDEKLEIDVILDQRKSKGVLEYLVRWKQSEGGPLGNESWEPAKNLVVDYAQAVTSFVKSLKTKRGKRSTSRSRKSSRSRSRSSSRSRKASAAAKSQSRDLKQQQQQQVVEQEERNTKPTRSSRSKGKLLTAELSVTVTRVTEASTDKHSSPESNSKTEPDSRRTQAMASSSTKTGQLEVQRVHNEQRPVRDDDLKPRSVIWKVADYAVIVLFVLSLLAALFLFMEKFVDLAEFKKQAFPNLSILQHRLEVAGQSLSELVSSGAHAVTHAWLYLLEQVKGAPEVKINTP